MTTVVSYWPTIQPYSQMRLLNFRTHIKPGHPPPIIKSFDIQNSRSIKPVASAFFYIIVELKRLKLLLRQNNHERVQIWIQRFYWAMSNCEVSNGGWSRPLLLSIEEKIRPLCDKDWECPCFYHILVRSLLVFIYFSSALLCSSFDRC